MSKPILELKEIEELQTQATRLTNNLDQLLEHSNTMRQQITVINIRLQDLLNKMCAAKNRRKNAVRKTDAGSNAGSSNS